MFSLRVRRIILFLSFVVFLITAPILLLYSTGYRYDFSRNRIIQTGTLAIESKDVNGAFLFLNNEQYPELLKTETFIEDLIPGEYLVRIEKEGYYMWAKKVIINSQLTSFLKDIILFKQAVPEQVVQGSIENLFVSPDGSKIAYIRTLNGLQEVFLYADQSKDIELLYKHSQLGKIESINWAASSKKVLLKLTKGNIIIALGNTPEVLNVSSLTPILFENLIWDSQSDNLLYGKRGNELYELNILGASAKKVVSIPQDEGILSDAFFAENQDLFYIIEGDATTLHKYNSLLDASIEFLDILPSQNYIFLGGNPQFITLIDRAKEKILVINKNPLIEKQSLQQERERMFDAVAALWRKKDDSLLLYNQFEIKSFDFHTNSETLINRYGKPIVKVLWHPEKHHVIIQFGKKVEIIEIGNNSGSSRNAYTVVDFDVINDIGINNNGSKLYFSGRIGKQEGLYTIELK